MNKKWKEKKRKKSNCRVKRKRKYTGGAKRGKYTKASSGDATYSPTKTTRSRGTSSRAGSSAGRGQTRGSRGAGARTAASAGAGRGQAASKLGLLNIPTPRSFMPQPRVVQLWAWCIKNLCSSEAEHWTFVRYRSSVMHFAFIFFLIEVPDVHFCRIVNLYVTKKRKEENNKFPNFICFYGTWPSLPDLSHK